MTTQSGSVEETTVGTLRMTTGPKGRVTLETVVVPQRPSN